MEHAISVQDVRNNFRARLFQGGDCPTPPASATELMPGAFSPSNIFDWPHS